jgi:hypothetical protein
VATAVVDEPEAPELAVDLDDETAADFLARLRVASVTGRLPADVGAWAVQVAAEHLPDTARRMARNRYLRAGANMISGTTWAKARRLEQEILVVRGLRARRGTRGRWRPREVTVGYYVRAALAIDPSTPASVRQILNILSV